MASLIGSKIERKEDKRFLTGRGQYTADINLVNQTYACFVRSPHARAKINKIDISKAEKLPGVIKILTGEDLAKDKIGGLIAGWKIVSQDGKDMKVPPHPPLAKDSVNYVGDHVAIVIGETLEEAKNASEHVNVSYKVQKAVVNTKDAMSSENIYEGIDSNLCFDFLLGDKGYAFPEIVAVPIINDETQIVDVEFRVNPGSRTIVRRINITGNERISKE